MYKMCWFVWIEWLMRLSTRVTEFNTQNLFAVSSELRNLQQKIYNEIRKFTFTDFFWASLLYSSYGSSSTFWLKKRENELCFCHQVIFSSCEHPAFPPDTRVKQQEEESDEGEPIHVDIFVICVFVTFTRHLVSVLGSGDLMLKSFDKFIDCAIYLFYIFQRISTDRLAVFSRPLCATRVTTSINTYSLIPLLIECNEILTWKRCEEIKCL